MKLRSISFSLEFVKEGSISIEGSVLERVNGRRHA